MNLDLSKVCDVEVSGINHADAPDFVDSYIADGWIKVDVNEFNKTAMPTNNKGFNLYRQLSEAELDWLNETQREFVYEQTMKFLF